MIDHSPDAWFRCPRPKPGAAVTLFCFPYAGGGIPVFHSWAAALPDSIEVSSVQLPGRGTRLREEPFRQITPLVQALTDALIDVRSNEESVVFFGHSLGALVAFEVARELRRRSQPIPMHLFVSGCSAPQDPYTDRLIHALPDSDFLEEIRQWSGTPPEVLEHQELMALLLPALRADFEVRETYSYQNEPPLPCSITAFGGLADHQVQRASLDSWRAQTKEAFSLHMLPGDHFFLVESQAALLELISQQVAG